MAGPKEKRTLKATWHGQVIAESDRTLEVGGYPYFPRATVRMDLLRAARKTPDDLECPHGVQFYDVADGAACSERAAWSYEAPRTSMKPIGRSQLIRSRGWRASRTRVKRCGIVVPGHARPTPFCEADPMRPSIPLAVIVALVVSTTTVHAQAIIAQSSGLTNPDHVIDFGANLYPNWTNITNEFTGITVTHAAYFTTGMSNNLVGGFLTNNFSGPPDTLTIKFASPIRDLSFVYHQIGPFGPSGFRAMLGTTVVDSFNNQSNQFQTNNYFGFTNIFFDELQIDFVSDFNLDTLAFNDPNQSPQPYCTAGTTTNGCNATVAANANPSLSLANACSLAVSNVEGQKSGLVFYGIDNSGFTPLPWATGSTSWLCVKPPTQRTAIQTSGGTVNACDGGYSLDWNAYQTANPAALGNPWSVGAKVYVQAWFRDPPSPKSTNLSNALEMTYVP